MTTTKQQGFAEFKKQHDYDLPAATLQRVRAVITGWPRHHGFGNAREVRKLFSDTIRRHASLVSAGPEGAVSLRSLPPDAVPAPARVSTPAHRGYL